MKKRGLTKAHEVYPGIYSISLPLAGKKPGPVNVYLCTGKKTTLLDTGTILSVGHLREGLAGLGLSFSDIDQVLITHGHIDHYGAARRIAHEAGREMTIAAHGEDVPMIERGMEASRWTFRNYYRLMGAPLHFRVSLLALGAVLHTLGETCSVNTVLHDGDVIDMGNYLARVVHTPGHTRGSVCFHLEKERLLFCGDHVLGHITPNAFVMIEDGFAVPRRMSQVEFYDSLARIERLEPEIVFPAHGDVISDLHGVIVMFREQFELRQNRILEILDGGTRSVYRIARLLFPEIRGRRLPLELFLAISEVYTNLQVLERDGKVISRRERGTLLFSKK